MNREKALKIRSQIDQHDATQSRIDSYKKIYTEKNAEDLGRYHAMYPWVAPEILIPLVLSGQENLLNDISKVAAKESMESGFTHHATTPDYHRKNVQKTNVNW